ncbi:MAG TPA: N-acetylmuramoyl-L-alanine amidase [Vicinamibacterales bacterium]|nr:N-acetylmuramoyl-L-alanine amidase [Vicinamibacterales bacterium]
MSLIPCSPRLIVLLGLALACAAAAQGPAPAQQPAPYTIVAREGRRPLAVRAIGNQEMFALEELGRVFGLTWREDQVAGGLVVTAAPKNQSVVLSLSQGLASVSGRLFSLPAPPARDGRAWYLPVDFVARVLPAIAAQRVELRKPSRLIVLGDLRVPRVAARHEPLGALARVTFDVAPATPHTVSQEAGRIVLRFEADALDATLPGAVNGEIVAAVRPGETPTAIAIDPGPRFSSFRTSDVPGAAGSVRVIVEAMAQSATTPAPSPATPTEPPPLLDLPAPGGLRTIVIDAGHGGDEEGARGPNGALEKQITLAVARRLKAALEARLGVRALLTRDADRTVSLDERAALANNNKADLFISLHVNASVRPAASGAEVFYLSLDDYGAEAARASHPESELLPVFGGGTRDIQLILWEMAQARYIEQSAVLAQIVEAELRERVPMGTRAIQQAPFRVLVGANMPAVLIELGFITNPQQERALTSEAFQQQVVQALVASIVRYRDSVAGSSPVSQPGPVR